MEELLIVVLQGLFEVLLDVLSYLPFDLSRSASPSSSTRRDTDDLLAGCFLWFMGGCVAGGLSLLVFDRSFLPTRKLRIANLVAAPVMAGFVSRTIARRREARGAFADPRRSFWQAFSFSLGVVLVRFAWGLR
jgi:hypothetical protein